MFSDDDQMEYASMFMDEAGSEGLASLYYDDNGNELEYAALFNDED